MSLTRRDLVVALATTCVVLAVGSVARTAPSVLTSAVFDWNAMKAEPTEAGEVRPVFRTPTATLDELECHITTLKAQARSHPPHVHPNEEVLIVREGQIEVFYKNAWHPAGPGSVVFLTGTDPHGLRNAGTTPATYYVLAWRSPGTKPADGPGRR
jgi:XRE family transcriptional regulator, regulator of sulfur utilization